MTIDSFCRQCFQQYTRGRFDDGYCSDDCEEVHDEQLMARDQDRASDSCDCDNESDEEHAVSCKFWTSGL